jgi:hypothetical protein
LEHWITNVVFIIFTIWALFADDLKMILTTIDADVPFSAIIIILQFFFLIEVVLSCVAIEGYFLGFFFWLDIISILSMILDIHWFYNMIIEQISISSLSVKQTRFHSRTAKVGSRAVRVLRVVRLIRIVRISKFYKFSENINNLENNQLSSDLKQESTQNINNLNLDLNSNYKDKSKVAKKLADSTMRRVIILVLAMIIGIILFNPNFYYNPISSLEFGIKMFNDYSSLDDPGLKVTFETYIASHLVKLF